MKRVWIYHPCISSTFIHRHKKAKQYLIGWGALILDLARRLPGAEKIVYSSIKATISAAIKREGIFGRGHPITNGVGKPFL